MDNLCSQNSHSVATNVWQHNLGCFYFCNVVFFVIYWVRNGLAQIVTSTMFLSAIVIPLYCIILYCIVLYFLSIVPTLFSYSLSQWWSLVTALFVWWFGCSAQYLWCLCRVLEGNSDCFPGIVSCYFCDVRYILSLLQKYLYCVSIVFLQHL